MLELTKTRVNKIKIINLVSALPKNGFFEIYAVQIWYQPHKKWCWVDEWVGGWMDGWMVE